MHEKRIIITTGGSGGHVFPAIVVGEYFKKNGYKVIIIGDEKLKKYINKTKLHFKIIPSGSSLKQFKSIMNLIIGFIKSLIILSRFKPNAVIGFGSYATLPLLFASKIKKIPIFLHEQNSYIGKINRFFCKEAINLFTAFQEIYGININYTNKIYFTGNPVREEAKIYYNENYNFPKNNEKFNILVTGGSGGASFFSKDLVRAFINLDSETKKKIKVFHQVKTEEELNEVKYIYNREIIESEVKMFFNDLPKIMFESNLVICRSGIGTASELMTIGRPTIFVPSPNVTNDHQTYNANFFKRSNACLILTERDFIAKNFAVELKNIINNKELLIKLANNMKRLAIIDAENEIYKTVNSFIEKNI